MRSHRPLVLAIASIALRLVFSSSSLWAQAAPPASVFHISPYAGYMVFGNFLNGPLGTSVSNSPGPLYGAQLGVSMTPNVQLIGNIGYANSNLQAGIPIFGGVSVGTSSVLMYDAGLEYDFGSSAAGGLPFAPFVQGGVGAMQYNIDAADILTTQATNFAGNVGVGADVSLGRGVALRLLAKDYIGKFNFQDATGINFDGSTTHNLAFTAGLRLDF